MTLSRRWDLHLQWGRDYSPAYGTDTVGYILNEEAAKRIGYKDPIGKRLTFWGKKGTIIGVVRNFHFNSLHEPIKPLIIHFGEEDHYGEMSWCGRRRDRPRDALAGWRRFAGRLNPQFPLYV